MAKQTVNREGKGSSQRLSVPQTVNRGAKGALQISTHTKTSYPTRNTPTSVGGGLGIKPYNSATPSVGFRTGVNTPGAARNTMYGSVPRKSVPLPPAPISTAVKPRVKPASAVVRTTTNMRTSPVKTAAPARAGGLGVSTGKTTGTTATRAGTGGKTVTSAYDKQMANALNRTNQPAGPTGKKPTMSNKNAMGGTGSAMGSKNGGGGGSKGGNLSGQGSGARTAGTSRTGGTKQNNPVKG